MAKKAGFEVGRVDYVGRSLNLARLLWNVGVMSKSRMAQRAVAKLSDALRLSSVHLRLNARDMQRAALRKPAR